MKYLIIIFGLIIGRVEAQQPVNLFSIQYGSSSIYIHTVNVENLRGAKPQSLHLEWTKQFNDSLHYHAAKANILNGWRLGYENFGTPILGSSIQALRFIEPHFPISARLSFSIRGQIGAGYFSDPNQVKKNKNPENNSYSTYIIPLLGLSTGIRYQLNKHWLINTQVGFNHSSNGGNRFPNRGINWFQFSTGISYSKESLTLKRWRHTRDTATYKKWFAEGGLLFSAGQQYNTKWMATRNYVAGISLQGYRTLSRINGLVAGTDIYINDISTENNSSNKLAVGIHGGHVFFMGKLDFFQQFGWNVINDFSFLSNTYTRLGFTYRVNKSIRLGCFLKANSDEADFVGTQLLYRL